MKLLTRTLLSAAALLAITSGSAWAQSQNLQFEGSGVIVITGGNSATITNDPGEGGVLFTKSNLIKFVKDKPVSIPIGQADFSFTSSGAVAGGAPRFSIGVDTNGDGKYDGFAFLDVNGCGGTAAAPTVVSTNSDTCTVYFNAQVFDNWDALVAAYPSAKVSYIPFIVADQPGTYVLTNIDVK